LADINAGQALNRRGPERDDDGIGADTRIDVTSRSSVAAVLMRRPRRRLRRVTAIVPHAGLSRTEQASEEGGSGVDMRESRYHRRISGPLIEPARRVVIARCRHLQPALDPAVAQQLASTSTDERSRIEAVLKDPDSRIATHSRRGPTRSGRARPVLRANRCPVNSISARCHLNGDGTMELSSAPER